MLPSLLIRDLHPFGKKEPPQRFTSGHSPEDSRNRDIPHLCSSNEHMRVVIQSICQIPQGSLKNGKKVCPHCELWVLTALSETCNAPSVCHLSREAFPYLTVCEWEEHTSSKSFIKWPLFLERLTQRVFFCSPGTEAWTNYVEINLLLSF